MPLLSFQKRSHLPHTGTPFNHGWVASVVRTLCGCGLVLLIAWLAYTSHLNLAATGFLELLLVLLVALKSGFWEATVVSVLANGCLDYFFTPPLFSLRISDPRNWIALTVFEIAALVVSRLSATAQQEASRAINREQEIQKLYDFSNELLRLSRSQQPGSQVLALIRRIFDIEAIVLFDSYNGSVERLGQNTEQLEAQTRAAYVAGADFSPTANGQWIRTLRTGSLAAGSIGFHGKGLTEIIVNALASLVAVALERSRSFEKESQAEAVRKSEQLRTAVLDALAHAYKTPLTAILTSSSGLLEIGQMLPFQEELISLINSEALRLSDLTGRLLRMSRLDSEEVQPRLQRIDTDDLIQATLSGMQGVLLGHPVHVEGLASGTCVEADPELVGMVLAQFLDNASKYSESAAPITVSVAVTPTEVHIGVHSRGSFISPEDREKIFERFYRSPEARSKADGTGIGLSVSKKIADAVHGRVWVTSEKDCGSTFSLALPQLPPASSPANR
jgi:two-component system sensor histidine kinase KdpD